MPNKNHTTTKEETEHHKTLKTVCEENSLLCLWYKAGIQAIESKYRNRIIVSDSKLFGGSVDFDKALQKEYGRDHRWDYGFEYEGNFIFIEIHPAQTSEIERMIGKVQALSKWLKTNCPDILQLPKFENGNRQFYWVSSGSNGILASGLCARKMALNHIKHVGSHFDYEKLKRESKV